MLSFLSALKHIGEDIEAGITVAAPIIGIFVPAAGPILTDIAEIIVELEGIGANPANTNLSPVTQAVATVSAVKQHTASKATATVSG
jgi:hypothetical protein